jgi:hypothetical protein
MCQSDDEAEEEARAIAMSLEGVLGGRGRALEGVHPSERREDCAEGGRGGNRGGHGRNLQQWGVCEADEGGAWIGGRGG